MRSSTGPFAAGWQPFAAGWQRRGLHEGYQRGRDRRRKVRDCCAAVFCMLLIVTWYILLVRGVLRVLTPKPVFLQDSLVVLRGL